MKRQLIAVGLGVLILVTFIFISIALAAPRRRPVSDSEPNNDFNEAEPLEIPGSSFGTVDNTPITNTVDFYVFSTTIGSEYQASLSIDSPQGLSLRIVLYDHTPAWINTSSSSTSNTSLTWTANDDNHYIKVQAVTTSTTTVKTANYVLDVVPKAVPPDTPTPTATNTPQPTNTPVPENDDYETNDDFNTAYTLPVATTISLDDVFGPANFYPVGNEDWFRFWAKKDRWYRVTTGDLGGVDTWIEIRNQDNDAFASDDDGGGGYASQVEWRASYDGYYYVRVTNKVKTEGTYNLTVEEVDAPNGATAVPPLSGADSCEDNADFDDACIIPANEAETYNLYPPYGSGLDNDFYKLWVKPGFIYECATSDLSPGIDPNMIVFNGPSWDNAVGGNDDVETGNLNSRFAYYATYEGWLYVLVGTGDRVPSDISDSNYTLLCERKTSTEGTATPDPQATTTPGAPAATSTPYIPPPPAVPTATPDRSLIVRPMVTPTPPSGPPGQATPGPRFIQVDLLVYYDANNDFQPGAGEGISGVSVQAFEAASNQLLTQGFTGDAGDLQFTISAQGPARVSVPFFGFSQLVSGEAASIYLRIPPQALPAATP